MPLKCPLVVELRGERTHSNFQMALAYNYALSFHMKPSNSLKKNTSFGIKVRWLQKQKILCAQKKRCLRCNTVYEDKYYSPIACSFHGHTTGEKGLFALAPPHQGIDGEWTDKSGVIVYKWNEKENRPYTGRSNWKRRWSCCAEYSEDAPPCRQGWHVSYDDGYTLY